MPDPTITAEALRDAIAAMVQRLRDIETEAVELRTVLADFQRVLAEVERPAAKRVRRSRKRTRGLPEHAVPSTVPS